MHRQPLLDMLRSYRSQFMEERSYVRQAVDFIESHDNVFERASRPYHITGSTWVVNPARSHALLMHHRKLGQWFQPGGHADGETDIIAVALRETAEETGLPVESLKLLDEAIFDVDIHTVPAMPEAPKHGHIDIRFLVELDDQLKIPGNDESHEILWVDLHRVAGFNNNMSTHRMVKKTHMLRRVL